MRTVDRYKKLFERMNYRVHLDNLHGVDGICR